MNYIKAIVHDLLEPEDFGYLFGQEEATKVPYDAVQRANTEKLARLEQQLEQLKLHQETEVLEFKGFAKVNSKYTTLENKIAKAKEQMEEQKREHEQQLQSLEAPII